MYANDDNTSFKAIPKHPQLNVQWEVKEREELADYYLHQARESDNLPEICFFLNGYMDIKNLRFKKQYLWNIVKKRVDNAFDNGYTGGDIARNVYVSIHLIFKIKRGEVDTIRKKSLLGIAFQLKEDLIIKSNTSHDE